MRRRKGRHEQHENLERWLLTYADMITLLMAFFIMMYSMSVLNLSKFREAAFSIRSGFGGVMDRQGKGSMGSNGSFSAKPSPIQGDTAGVPWRVIRPLVSFIESISKDSSVQIGEDNRGIVITLRSDQMLFKPGSADINPKAYPVLGRIAATMQEIDNRVQIEGHTCDLPPRTGAYASNWELSTARATTVLRYLVETKHMAAQRFSAAGYGSVRPLEPNKTQAGRKANRRVEIVILRPEAEMGAQPKSTPRPISDPTDAVMQRRID